jgi:tetratricopeptide (TPR) repeat protein
MCRTVGDAELEMMSSVFTLATLLEIGDRRRAKIQVEGLRRIALNNDCVHGRWFPPMYEAMFAIATGRFSDAEALIRAYHSIGQRLDDVNVTQTCLLQMTEILWQTGRAAAVVGPVEENIEKHPALHEWQGALVFLNARAGRLGEARNGLAALAGRDLPGLSYRMNAAIGVSALVEAAWILEDSDAAAKLLRVVERWGERLVVAGYGVLVWGSTARLRGHLASLLGELEEAEAWYRRALSVERRERNCVWRARTQLAYARLLRLRSMRGDRRKASRLVSQAQRFAEMRGLSSLAEEAAAMAGKRS